MSEVQSRSRSDPWDLLGGVRFVLALIVVAIHVKDLSGTNWLASGLQRLGAFPAVLGFLIISGYSIAHSINQRQDGYYTRRFRRIYPLYALAVLAALLPSTLNGWNTVNTPRQVAYNLVFLQSFHSSAVPGNGVVWSLGVEVAFYVLAPLLVRLRTPTLIGLGGVSAVAFVAFPHTHLAYYSQLSNGLPFLFLAWAWMAGFIYYRVRQSKLAGPALIGVVIVLLDLNPMFLTNHSMLTMVASLVALIVAPQARLPAPIRRVLALGGDLSYPLYLFHAPLLLTYAGYFHGHSQWFVLGWSVPLAAGMLVIDAALRRPVAHAIHRAVATAATVRQELVAIPVLVRAAVARLDAGRALSWVRFAPVANVSIALAFVGTMVKFAVQTRGR